MPVAPIEHEPLTQIEHEVLRLFGAALPVQVIGELLGFDLEEVVRMKQEAMRKLGFTTRLQAMNYVRPLTS